MDITKITDNELFELAKTKEGLSRFYLYPELAKRTSSSLDIKKLLFEDIVDKEKQNIELSPRGSIMKLSWIPVLQILLNSDESVKKELRESLKSWSNDEVESLKLYLKNNPQELEYI